MSFILSAQRDHESYSYKNLQRYFRSLGLCRNKLPKEVHAVASQSEWYSFDSPLCPHDGRLDSLEINERPIGSDSPQKCSIKIELNLSSKARIRLDYGYITHYALKFPNELSHGSWRYDEFSLADNGEFLHTIEWGNGAVWEVKARAFNCFWRGENTKWEMWTDALMDLRI